MNKNQKGRNQMKKYVDNIMSREMDRSEFLRFSGVGLLMFLGGNTIIQTLGSMSGNKVAKTQGSASSASSASSAYGYGSSPYGGLKG